MSTFLSTMLVKSLMYSTMSIIQTKGIGVHKELIWASVNLRGCSKSRGNELNLVVCVDGGHDVSGIFNSLPL